jgi:hypothetical protein
MTQNPTTLLPHYVRNYNRENLKPQAYPGPRPRERMLRNHVQKMLAYRDCSPLNSALSAGVRGGAFSSANDVYILFLEPAFECIHRG